MESTFLYKNESHQISGPDAEVGSSTLESTQRKQRRLPSSQCASDMDSEPAQAQKYDETQNDFVYGTSDELPGYYHRFALVARVV